MGVMLPNNGPQPSVDEIDRFARLAARLGFDSVWAAEHVIVSSAAPEEYHEVMDPFETLAWVAGRHEGIDLGTSINLLPLHNPFVIAKRAATLQRLSGGRFRLGVGVGWHEDEYRFMRQGFADRGQRADEALRLLRELWTGARAFRGEHWAIEDARFGPLPDPPPEIWVGGNTDAAVRRAREFGQVWHPIAPAADAIAAVRQGWPDGRIVPRVFVRLGRHEGSGLQGSPDEVMTQIERLVEAGASGLVLDFASADDSARDLETVGREVAPRVRALERRRNR